jgi:hypothetical protein
MRMKLNSPVRLYLDSLSWPLPIAHLQGLKAGSHQADGCGGLRADFFRSFDILSATNAVCG